MTNNINSQRDIPAIFSGSMVRAMLDGRKTMTRRLAWRLKDVGDNHTRVATPWQKVKPGDRLWVRENFAHVGTCDPGFLTYQATYPDDLSRHGLENVPATLKEAGYKWTPCIHMPRRLSRLTLVVSAIKVEPLQSISEEDARAEGVQMRWLRSANCAPRSLYFIPDPTDGTGEREHSGPTAKSAFEMLWLALHGTESWDENPEVVALTFRVIKSNIDTAAAQAA